jgi:hypothetical protein
MSKFIIRNFYSAYISKEYKSGAKYAFTREQKDILIFAKEEDAKDFIDIEMKEYLFNDLEIIPSHF